MTRTLHPLSTMLRMEMYNHGSLARRSDCGEYPLMRHPFAKHPMVETDCHGESSRAFAMQRARGQLAAASAECTEPRSK